MTSSLHRKTGLLPRRQAAVVRPGFTLIEMLVVMGIILLLIAILLPAINRAYRNSVRTSMAADLQVISQALEAYHGDFGDYPRPGATLKDLTGANTFITGQVALCWALIAPGPAKQDGYGDPTNANVNISGPGFRLRGTMQGTVKGPYLPVDRFPLGTESGVTVKPVTNGMYDDMHTVIADRYGNVILYFVRNKAANTATANGYFHYVPYPALPVNLPAYNLADADPGTGTVFSNYTFPANSPAAGMTITGEQNLQTQVPGFSLTFTGGAPPFTPAINYSPANISTAPYILWSSGPDGVFGLSSDGTTSDDVLNVQ